MRDASASEYDMSTFVKKIAHPSSFFGAFTFHRRGYVCGVGKIGILLFGPSDLFFFLGMFHGVKSSHLPCLPSPFPFLSYWVCLPSADDACDTPWNSDKINRIRLVSGGRRRKGGVLCTPPSQGFVF